MIARSAILKASTESVCACFTTDGASMRIDDVGVLLVSVLVVTAVNTLSLDLCVTVIRDNSKRQANFRTAEHAVDVSKCVYGVGM